MLSLCGSGPSGIEKTQGDKLCSHFAPSLLLPVCWDQAVDRRPPSPSSHLGQGGGHLRSWAAWGSYLTAPLFQLDFDEKDEADQGDHDEERQENPHVEVLCGLLEQNTHPMSHRSLQPGDRRMGQVSPGWDTTGVTQVCLSPCLQATPGGSANLHTCCAPRAQTAPLGVAGAACPVPAKSTPVGMPSSPWKSAKFAVTSRRGPSK